MLQVLAQLPGDLPDKANQIVDQVKANPVLLAMLIGVGVITAVIFLWGITKQVFKAAIVAGVLSVGAWYWYFNIR
jgi:transposase